MFESKKFKPNLLLKIVAVLMIIGGVFVLAGGVVTLVMGDTLAETMTTMGVPMTSGEMMAGSITNLLVGAIGLVSGIFGVSGKSAKWASFMMIAYCAITVIMLIVSVVQNGFAISLALDLVFPALYAWGVYQSV